MRKILFFLLFSYFVFSVSGIITNPGITQPILNVSFPIYDVKPFASFTQSGIDEFNQEEATGFYKNGKKPENVNLFLLDESLFLVNHNSKDTVCILVYVNDNESQPLDYTYIRIGDLNIKSYRNRTIKVNSFNSSEVSRIIYKHKIENITDFTSIDIFNPTPSSQAPPIGWYSEICIPYSVLGIEFGKTNLKFSVKIYANNILVGSWPENSFAYLTSSTYWAPEKWCNGNSFCSENETCVFGSSISENRCVNLDSSAESNDSQTNQTQQCIGDMKFDMCKPVDSDNKGIIHIYNLSNCNNTTISVHQDNCQGPVLCSFKYSEKNTCEFDIPSSLTKISVCKESNQLTSFEFKQTEPQAQQQKPCDCKEVKCQDNSIIFIATTILLAITSVYFYLKTRKRSRL